MEGLVKNWGIPFHNWAVGIDMGVQYEPTLDEVKFGLTLFERLVEKYKAEPNSNPEVQRLLVKMNTEAVQKCKDFIAKNEPTPEN